MITGRISERNGKKETTILYRVVQNFNHIYQIKTNEYLTVNMPWWLI
jgi:hypothetical protein